MNLRCFKCERYFKPMLSNVKIIGPDLEVICPFCFDKYEGKINCYVGVQVGKHVALSPIYARKMIDLAEYIELNTSEYYKEKGMRHGKKKVRNVPDRRVASGEGLR